LSVEDWANLLSHDKTEERFLATVRALMQLEGSRFGKPFLTYVTDERLLATVNALMNLEG
jgi:hypothetical protein